MNKIIVACLKPLTFVPALLVMYMIFSFSAQTGNDSGQLSYQVSQKLVQIGARIMDMDLDQDEISYYADKYHYLVRKLGHMTEYFILAISLCFPLYAYKVRGIWLLIIAGVLCVGFAATDEYHQSFVAGRGPSVKDVCIDSFGALMGILVSEFFGWISVRSNEELKLERRDRKAARRKRKRKARR